MLSDWEPGQLNPVSLLQLPTSSHCPQPGRGPGLSVAPPGGPVALVPLSFLFPALSPLPDSLSLCSGSPSPKLGLRSLPSPPPCPCSVQMPLMIVFVVLRGCGV